MVIFSQWSDIQKGYSKTRGYTEKSDFSVVADAHAHQEIPECPFPTLTWNGQLKKYAELFEKKVRVMVEEVGGWVCFSPELVWGWQS